MAQPPNPQPPDEPASGAQPQPPSPSPINFNLRIPVLNSLLNFLQEVMIKLGFQPELAVIVLIDVAVLVIGLFVLALLAPAQRIQGLIILVVLILLSTGFAYLVTVRKKNG